MSSLKIRNDDGLLVVEFAETQLTEPLAAKVGAELQMLTSQATDARILLNFAGVKQISSMMIGQLFMLRSKCQSERVDLKVCSMAPMIKEAMEIVQLTRLLEIYDDEEEACDAFHQEFDVAAMEDDREIVAQYRKSADEGNAESRFKLAKSLEEGFGTEQNSGEALTWYQKAAEQGHVEAQYTLGVKYAYGFYVEQDYDKAIKWYRLAAEQGHADSQYVLGMSHNFGISVGEDLAEAERWYRKAAEQGNQPAEQALKQLQVN